LNDPVLSLAAPDIFATPLCEAVIFDESIYSTSNSNEKFGVNEVAKLLGIKCTSQKI